MPQENALYLDPRERRYFRRKVLHWFRSHRRRFPWRARIDPFHILVAEILLQQTDAKKVAAIYDRFLQAFPTPESLARASEPQVSKFISKIGLNYRTARLINAAAAVQDRFRGRVPSDLDSLLSLPGVGPYVANAVLVVAFQHRVAVLDTNVIRVLERFFGLRSRRRRPHTDSVLWAAAQELLPLHRQMARTWNWALLDFAATVCRHHGQLCRDCPCRRLCHLVSTPRYGL